jgi:hypothetical protein
MNDSIQMLTMILREGNDNSESKKQTKKKKRGKTHTIDDRLVVDLFRQYIQICHKGKS